MNRRQFNGLPARWFTTFAVAWVGLSNTAEALTLAQLSASDAAKGLKTALEKSALAAVSQLGAADGFLGNPQVRIPLPGVLQDVAPMLRTFGQGGRLDELHTAINRAAEAAVPGARDLLLKAVQNLSVADAKAILSGGNTAVTDYFADKTRPALLQSFLAPVTQVTQKAGLTEKYNSLAGKAQEYGLIGAQEANLAQYVTGKTVEGLYFMIAEEEKKIRQNPAGYGSALLGKVFGVLR